MFAQRVLHSSGYQAYQHRVHIGNHALGKAVNTESKMEAKYSQDSDNESPT